MYFEDYILGRVFALAPVCLSEEDIVAFARQYDPQPFHTDPTSNEAVELGGLIASGWQTVVLAMRSFVAGYISQQSNLPSPGIDELRWHAPVRPGDELTIRATVLHANVSRSRPDRGVVRSRLEALNIIRRDPTPR